MAKKISDLTATALQLGDVVEIYRPSAATSDLRAPLTVPTYQAVTAAAAQAGYTITRTSGDILVELTQDLTAAATFVLPTTGLQEGDIVRVLRSAGGFFDWASGGDILGYRDDYIIFQRASGAWTRVALRGRSGARRSAVGRDLLLSDNGATIAVTSAATYNVSAAAGTSTGWRCKLIQRGVSAVVTLTLDGTLTQVGGGPLVTDGDGVALLAESLGSAQVQVSRIPVQGGAGSAITSGIVIPASGDMDFSGSEGGLIFTQTPGGGGAFLPAPVTAIEPQPPVVVQTTPRTLLTTEGVEDQKWVLADIGSSVFRVPADAAAGRAWIIENNTTATKEIDVVGDPAGSSVNGVTGGSVFLAAGRGRRITITVRANSGGSAPTVQVAGDTTETKVLDGDLDCADRVISRPELRDVAETAFNITSWPSGAALNIDYTNGGYQYGTTGAGNITAVVVSNWPASGKLGCLTLEITQGATARTIDWGGAYRFVGGANATLTAIAGAVDVFTLMTRNAGSTILVFEGGKGFAV